MKSINITNGDAAAGTLKQAIKCSGEEMLVFSDVISCGPLKPFTNMEEWASFREKYWHHIEERNNYEFTYFRRSHNRNLYANTNELNEADEIHIWLGSSLSDQLFLCFMMMLLRHLQVDFSEVYIHQFFKLEGYKIDIQGLGVMNPDQVIQADKQTQLSDSAINTLIEAWNVITKSSPESYIEFIKEDKDELPLLVRALRFLIYRYPDINTGLSTWDEALLGYTNSWGQQTKAARVIGYCLGDAMDGCDLTGDMYLFARFKKIASESPEPLINMNVLDRPMRETTVEITDFGLQALEGKANTVKTNGIDDWVGGVHLSSSNKTIWCRDGDSLIQVEI